ncbi:MAG: hypothetical protein RBT20_09620 [Syntrophales bacterium]|jgi:hypothetical protein|nr:hypothetical protein [Syntrophales bacterium]
MKKTSVLLLLATILLLSGCAYHYTLPDVGIPVGASALPAAKIPVRAGIQLPDENLTLTKTWVNPALESESFTLTVPFGKLLKRSAQDIFPAVFDGAEIFSGKAFPSGVDLIYAPSIKEFSFDFGAMSLSQQTLIARLQLVNAVTSTKGDPVFSDETATETQKTVKPGFSEQGMIDNWATTFAAAVNDALLKAARVLADSGEIQAYAKTGPGVAGEGSRPAGPAPKGQPSQPPADLQALRVKLKDAFEKGAITAEQLSRALDEGGRAARSKILDAFLEGKIDANKFGELY